MKALRFAVLVVLVGVVAVADRLEDTTYVPYEHKAIQYFETPVDDTVRALDDRIDQGKDKLDFEPGGLSYLSSLLKHLGINADSQVLCFRRTAFRPL